MLIMNLKSPYIMSFTELSEGEKWKEEEEGDGREIVKGKHNQLTPSPVPKFDNVFTHLSTP